MSAHESKSRRSFLTEVLTSAAGAWLAVTSGALFGAGCASAGGASSDKPGDGGLGSLKAARKYGGPPPPRPDAGAPEVTEKYGGPPETVPEPAPAPSAPENQPVTKYGGPSRPRPDASMPVTKYGGPWR